MDLERADLDEAEPSQFALAPIGTGHGLRLDEGRGRAVWRGRRYLPRRHVDLGRTDLALCGELYLGLVAFPRTVRTHPPHSAPMTAARDDALANLDSIL